MPVLNYKFLFIIIILIKLNSAANINVNSDDILKNSTYRIGKSSNQPSTAVEQCTTQAGLTGLCMKRTECTRNSGIVSGYCGTFGVCCELNLKCSGTSKLKKTIIRNPEKLPHRCIYHFQAYSNRVCQLRIDFDVVIAQPTIRDNGNGFSSVKCILDKFEIGSNTICGTNIKQHVYLNFDIANGFTDVVLSFILADREQNTNIQGYWNLVVTQLECPSVFRSNENALSNYKMLLHKPLLGDIELLAPQGCLQYFHEPQGIIESFNYNDGIGPYLGNMRYGICFKRNSDDDGVQLSATVFEIGAASYSNDFIDSDCHSRIIPNNIPNDYLAIPESILATSPKELLGTYYCGNSLQGNDLLHAPPGPFAIYFISDDLYTSEYPEIGFKIKYKTVKL